MSNHDIVPGSKADIDAAVQEMLGKYPNAVIEEIIQELSPDEYNRQVAKVNKYPIRGGAIGLVFMKDGALVLTGRTQVQIGWALPGGRVEDGEAFDKAFIREVEEECGVKIEVNKLLVIQKKIFTCGAKTPFNFLLMVFAGTVITDNKPYQTSEAINEGLEIGIFNRNNLPEGMLNSDREKIVRFAS